MAINTGSVIKGGLVSGLIINIGETILNIPILGERMAAEAAARNLPPFDNALITVTRWRLVPCESRRGCEDGASLINPVRPCALCDLEASSRR